MWGDYHAREVGLYLLRLTEEKPYLEVLVRSSCNKQKGEGYVSISLFMFGLTTRKLSGASPSRSDPNPSLRHARSRRRRR